MQQQQKQVQKSKVARRDNSAPAAAPTVSKRLAKLWFAGEGS